jgi:hypothetical protein
MALRYKEAFGLKDNPFGPRYQFGQVPPPLTRELQINPLLLHKDAGLGDLYCDKISSFRKACEKMEARLESDGYSADPPERGVSSYLVAIEGDSGAGKTTLATRMVQLVRKRTPSGVADWHVDELFLRSANNTVAEQVASLEALEARVTAAAAPYNCVLIDDLLADAYLNVTSLYDKLTSQRVVFLVFTSSDSAMSKKIDSGSHNVQRHALGPLSPDDAIAYVTARYQLFRVPSANGINALPLFPFDEKDIRTAVQVRSIVGATTARPVNLRLIATVLQRALADRLDDMNSKNAQFDVGSLPTDKLRELLIKIAQSYEVMVRK